LTLRGVVRLDGTEVARDVSLPDSDEPIQRFYFETVEPDEDTECGEGECEHA
jgi:hypothetical protein